MSTSGTISHRPGSARKAFTLVELLVVIGIIAVLISILLPSLAKARQSAMKVACAANMRSIGQMFALYESDNKGKLPTAQMGVWNNDTSYVLGAVWPHLISPNGQPPANTRWDWKWDDYDNYVAATKTFVCPTQAQDPDIQRTYILMGQYHWASLNADTPTPSTMNGVFGYVPERLVTGPSRQPGKLQTSETIMMAEMRVTGPEIDPVTTTVPRKFHIGGNFATVNVGQLIGDFKGPWAHEMEGSNYLFVDGHVEYQQSPVRYRDGAWVGNFDNADFGATDDILTFTRQFMVDKSVKDPGFGATHHAAWWYTISNP